MAKVGLKLKYYLKKLIRQGFTFKKIFKELEKSQYFSAEQLEELQNEKLRKIIEHCYKNVPYYTELFDNLNLKPEDIQTKEDLKKLPFMDKYTVRENFDKLIAKNKCKRCSVIGETSGTTGTPLRIYRDYYSVNFENAAANRHYASVVDLGARKITLRGQLITPVEQQEPPFWGFNPADNELIMSSYHLSQKTASIFIEKIKEFNPQIIYAYPSSAYLLAKYFAEANETLNLKAVFTSSEKLEEKHRELIEKTFNCKIYDWYGQAERVAAIGQCEKGTYHIIEDYSIVEIIATEDELELVGTTLDNYIMPLLRYKTGDYIELSEHKCNCGRNFREVKKIFGREANYILITDGPKYVAFNHIPRGVENVIELQFVQEKINELIINVVTSGNFSQKDKDLLIKNTLEHTCPDLSIIINEVEQIPRGANGKFKEVINKLIGKDNEPIL